MIVLGYTLLGLVGVFVAGVLGEIVFLMIQGFAEGVREARHAKAAVAPEPLEVRVVIPQAPAPEPKAPEPEFTHLRPNAREPERASASPFLHLRPPENDRGSDMGRG